MYARMQACMHTYTHFKGLCVLPHRLALWVCVCLHASMQARLCGLTNRSIRNQFVQIKDILHPKWHPIECIWKVFRTLDFFHILLRYRLILKCIKYFFINLQTIPHNGKSKTQSCLEALRTISLNSWLGFCSTVGPYTDRCVPFQLMSNQFNYHKWAPIKF